jgi:hypothetical protein
VGAPFFVVPNLGRPGSAPTATREPPTQPATSEPTPVEPAQPPDSSGSPPAEAPSGSQTTSEPTAAQQEDWKAKLTPEQRRELIAETDPEELFQANDRLGGHVGKLAQRQAQQDRKTERLATRLQKKAQAVQERNPDAALEVAEEELTESQEYQQAHERQQETRRAAWTAVENLFTSGILPKEVTDPLKGKEYGEADADPVEAARAFYKDLHDGLEKVLTKRIEARLTPQIEKRLRAELLGEEPSPDLGGGAGSNGSHRFTRADIARMSPAEYERGGPVPRDAWNASTYVDPHERKN